MTATNMCSNFGGFRYHPTTQSPTLCTHVDHTQLVDPLPFKIICTNHFILDTAHTCISTHVSAHMYQHTHVSGHTCISTHKYQHTQISAHTCISTHMYQHTQVSAHMYQDTHVSAHTCISTHMYQHTHVSAHTCISTHMYQHTHVSAHTCISTHMYQHTHVSVHTCISTHMYQHTCISTHYVVMLLLTMCKHQYMPYLVAMASFKDLVTVAQENSTNQTADVLVKEQLQRILCTW